MHLDSLLKYAEVCVTDVSDISLRKSEDTVTLGETTPLILCFPNLEIILNQKRLLQCTPSLSVCIIVREFVMLHYTICDILLFIYNCHIS